MLTEEKRNEIADSLNSMTWAALNKYESFKKQIDELAEFAFGHKLGETDKPAKYPPETIYNAAVAQLNKLFQQQGMAWGIYLSASEAREKLRDVPYIATDEVFGDFIVDPAGVLEKESENTTPEIFMDEALSA